MRGTHAMMYRKLEKPEPSINVKCCKFFHRSGRVYNLLSLLLDANTTTFYVSLSSSSFSFFPFSFIIIKNRYLIVVRRVARFRSVDQDTICSYYSTVFVYLLIIRWRYFTVLYYIVY